MKIMENDIRVVLDNLPTSVKGFVYVDSSYNPCIVLNARLPAEVQREAYAHEVNHILHDDMTNYKYREY